MLGYVKIEKGELKVREYEVYTGYYCGICKSIGKRYGQLPRMALSYDAAFFAILLSAVDDKPDSPAAEHCIGHHIKKKTIIRSEAVDFAADIMLILAWYKLLDDVNDDGKLSARAAMTAFGSVYRKLAGKYPKLCSSIKTGLEDLSELEDSCCANLDMAADAFSKIMGDILECGIRHLYGNHADDICGGAADSCRQSGNSAAPILKAGLSGSRQMTLSEAAASAGYYLGKWIYLIDAADDIEENIASGTYNPLLYRFSFDSSRETPEEFRTRINSSLSFILYSCLAALGDSLNRLDFKKNAGIIENIVYFGLNRKTEEILKGDFNESI